jgi:hypothetical protein
VSFRRLPSARSARLTSKTVLKLASKANSRSGLLEALLAEALAPATDLEMEE